MSKATTKTMINASIKQNGRQEITGSVLNGVLIQMVNQAADEADVTAKLALKQNTISDLEQIRSNATSGKEAKDALPSYRLKADQDLIDATKASDAQVVHRSGNETINGNKTFNGDVTIDGQNVATRLSTIEGNVADKAEDDEVMHNTGNESVGGNKTFTGKVVVEGKDVKATLTSLETSVATKATDSQVVHKSGDETIGGNKTFTGSVVVGSKNVGTELTQLSSEIGDLSDLETTDKSSLVNAINEARQSGGGGGSTTIVDNLESDSTTSALSAKQGKVLKGLVDAKPSNNDVMLLGSATGIQYSQHVYGSQAFESLVVKSFSLDNFGSERLSAFLTYGYTDDGNIYFKFIDLYGGGKIRLQNIAVPIADTDATNKSYVDTAVGGKYTKPSGGIPKTDLASAVQTSLGKADTALQSHQDISGKADKITSANSGTAFDANKIYKLGTISGTQSFSLNASSEAYAEYMIEFSTGDTAPSITWNMPNIKWMGGTAPTINANKSYYVSILDNLAVCGEF